MGSRCEARVDSAAPQPTTPLHDGSALPDSCAEKSGWPATFPPAVQGLAERLLHDPLRIDVPALTPQPTIQQRAIQVDTARRTQLLRHLFEIHQWDRVLVNGVVSKDHVHILVSCPPSMAPSEIIREIKGRTSSKPLRRHEIDGFDGAERNHMAVFSRTNAALLNCTGRSQDRSQVSGGNEKPRKPWR